MVNKSNEPLWFNSICLWSLSVKYKFWTFWFIWHLDLKSSLYVFRGFFFLRLFDFHLSLFRFIVLTDFSRWWRWIFPSPTSTSFFLFFWSWFLFLFFESLRFLCLVLFIWLVFRYRLPFISWLFGFFFLLIIIKANIANSINNFLDKNSKIVNRLNSPGNNIQPNKIKMHEVNNSWVSLRFIHIESYYEHHSQ